MQGEEKETGSGIFDQSHLSRPPARSHEPILREESEPHASRGHHRTQDVADVEAVYALESGGFGGASKMIWEFLGSSFVSSIVVLLILFLFREWIKTRLKVDIQHEADIKLESFKAALKGQSDAASIILNSQLQNILSVQSTALSSFSYAQRAAMERKLKAIEEIWKAIMNWRYDLPVILGGFIDVLMPMEYKDIGSHREYEKFKNEIGSKFYRELSDVRRRCEQHRPFVGEYIWSIFIVYLWTIGRIIYLLEEGASDPSKFEWDKDKAILFNLKGIFDEKEIQEFTNLKFKKVSWLENKFETKFLLSAEKIISGKDFGEDALKAAIDIMDKLPDIETSY